MEATTAPIGLLSVLTGNVTDPHFDVSSVGAIQ